jgi:hypothetical protein
MEQNINQIGLPKTKNEFTVETGVVDLPSGGIFYEDGLSQVTYKFMTTEDEDILTSQTFMRNGSQLDHLLKLKVVDPDGKVNVSRLLACDKDAILLKIRISGYGSDYEVRITDPHDFEGKQFDTIVDLDLLEPKILRQNPESNSKEFTYTLKDTDINFRFKLLNAEENERISKTIEANQKMFGGNSKSITTLLISNITEINGNREKMYIANYVRNMKPKYSIELRSFINEVTPGLDMNYEFISPSTGEPFFSSFEFRANLFYPNLKY